MAKTQVHGPDHVYETADFMCKLECHSQDVVISTWIFKKKKLIET